MTKTKTQEHITIKEIHNETDIIVHIGDIALRKQDHGTRGNGRRDKEMTNKVHTSEARAPRIDDEYGAEIQDIDDDFTSWSMELDNVYIDGFTTHSDKYAVGEDDGFAEDLAQMGPEELQEFHDWLKRRTRKS